MRSHFEKSSFFSVCDNLQIMALDVNVRKVALTLLVIIGLANNVFAGRHHVRDAFRKPRNQCGYAVMFAYCR